MKKGKRSFKKVDLLRTLPSAPSTVHPYSRTKSVLFHWNLLSLDSSGLVTGHVFSHVLQVSAPHLPAPAQPQVLDETSHANSPVLELPCCLPVQPRLCFKTHLSPFSHGCQPLPCCQLRSTLFHCFPSSGSMLLQAAVGAQDTLPHLPTGCIPVPPDHVFCSASDTIGLIRL